MSNNLDWSTIVELASQNPEFKALLLENPRLAIEEAIGVSLPADFEYVVHEQKVGTVHLVLPTSTDEFVAETITQNDILQSGVFLETDDALTGEILQSGVFLETDDAA